MPTPAAAASPKEEKVTLVTEVVDGNGEDDREREIVPSSENPPGETSEESPVESEKMNEPVDEAQKEMVEDLYKSSTPVVSPEISAHKSAALPFATWVVVVLALAFLVGGGLIVYLRGPINFSMVLAKPTPTPTPSPTPTPTPVATVSRADIRIKILNGGGVAGAASKMKTLLEDKGYTVVGTGNADVFTYDKTEISVKVGQEAVLTLLEADLKDAYSVGQASGDLAAETAYDVQIIVGKE